jgi:ParB family transcriptional regulator, chromosome partitioning protein
LNKVNPNSRPNVEWVSIEEVLPNPLNPRKNDAIRTEEMQGIIKKRGWEEPLTVYKKGKIYVVLAGHRRLYAARQAKVKQLPVFIVDAPQTHQEEIERIASLQSGRVDWTPFEWARFTYERWIAWGQPNLRSFAREINLTFHQVKNYVTVLNYFPIYEIESGLKNGALTLSALDALHDWIQSLKKHHPNIIETLTEEMIRKVLIEKLESKMATRETLRRAEFLSKAEESLVKEFILNKGFNLQHGLEMVKIDLNKKSFHGSIISINMLKNTVTNIDPVTKDEATKAVDALTTLQKDIADRIKRIKKANPELEEQTKLW